MTTCEALGFFPYSPFVLSALTPTGLRLHKMGGQAKAVPYHYH